jgi:hypothetical protein
MLDVYFEAFPSETIHVGESVILNGKISSFFPSDIHIQSVEILTNNPKLSINLASLECSTIPSDGSVDFTFNFSPSQSFGEVQFKTLKVTLDTSPTCLCLSRIQGLDAFQVIEPIPAMSSRFIHHPPMLHNEFYEVVVEFLFQNPSDVKSCPNSLVIINCDADSAVDESIIYVLNPDTHKMERQSNPWIVEHDLNRSLRLFLKASPTTQVIGMDLKVNLGVVTVHEVKTNFAVVAPFSVEVSVLHQAFPIDVLPLSETLGNLRPDSRVPRALCNQKAFAFVSLSNNSRHDLDVSNVCFNLVFILLMCSFQLIAVAFASRRKI